MTTNISGLRDRGIEAVGFNFSPLITQDEKNIYVLQKNLTAIIFFLKFAYHLFTSTHIHWIYGGRSKISVLLMKIIGLLKSKKFVEYCGSDARSLEKMCDDIDHYDISRFDDEDKKRLGVEKTSISTQRRFKEYGYQAIANSIEISDYMDEKINPTFFEYNRSINLLDIKTYRSTSSQALGIPLITHIPSNPKIKGTDYFLAAVKKLKDEGLADYKMLSGVSRDTALKAISQSTIIVDQLIIGEYGVFAIEAMALDKPTVCFIRNKLQKRYEEEFEGFPIINANIMNIYGVLKELLLNLENTRRIGNLGCDFVKRYHTSEVNIQRLIKIYQS